MLRESQATLYCARCVWATLAFLIGGRSRAAICRHAGLIDHNRVRVLRQEDSVDQRAFAGPATPVTMVSTPVGMFTVIFFRLCRLAFLMDICPVACRTFCFTGYPRPWVKRVPGQTCPTKALSGLHVGRRACWRGRRLPEGRRVSLRGVSVPLLQRRATAVVCGRIQDS
jgi:hypothetical protein